jgi:hypothetical protein
MHCTQCGAAVPADAKFCPVCGAAIAAPQPQGGSKPKKPKPTAKEQAQGCAVLFVLIVVVVALLGMCSGKSEQQKAADASASAEDKRKGFHCLSAWDGSNRSLVEQVKAGLRDPSSFEHDETRITPEKNGKHTVFMRYRARNGFGGMNVATAAAQVDHVTCDATLLSNDE